MKYLKIQNNGELDIRLIALMGGTTKANDKFKIGQFGTGLKYTLAYLYRNNIDFKIFSGSGEVKIHLEEETIKDQKFEIICINDHRTSITTQMGNQWDAWMIIREIWCNALDEGGELRNVIFDEELKGEENKTTFYIQLIPEVQKVLDSWDSYFIHNEEPLFSNDAYAIYENDGKNNLKLYKQGVLIYQHPHTKSLFNYDIKGADINELREFRGSVSMEVFNALASPNEKVISHFLNNVKEEMYEGSELDYDWFQSFSKIWKQTLGDNKIARAGSYSSYSEKGGVDIDFSNVIELPKKVYKALIKNFEGIGALKITDDKSEFCEIKNVRLEEKIKECILELSECSYFMNSELRLCYGIFMNNKKTNALNKKQKELMFSEVCLNLTNKEICAILVRNNEEFTSEFHNADPQFLTHFINLYTNALLS